MNPEEKIRLKRQYAQFADAQITQMIKDGPAAYVDGAYALLLEEARRRGLEEEVPPGPDAQAAQEEESPPPAAAAEDLTFLELAVINSMGDREAARTALEAAEITHNFLTLHIRQERELPAALLVDQSRLDDAIRALAGVLSGASIPLW